MFAAPSSTVGLRLFDAPDCIVHLGGHTVRVAEANTHGHVVDTMTTTPIDAMTTAAAMAASSVKAVLSV